MCVQALLLCKREMIYRDTGLGTRQALHSNSSRQDLEVGLHPDTYNKLSLSLRPSLGLYDKWRLYKIHNFVVVGDQWTDLAKQVSFSLQGDSTSTKIQSLNWTY